MNTNRKRWRLRLLLSLWCGLNSLWACADAGFALSEHLAAGQAVHLLFAATTPASQNPLLHLPNGLSLSYADIVSLGDLYAVPNQPVAAGLNEAEQAQRYLAAFASLAYEAQAIVAHHSQQRQDLELAYALEAYAAHYLSDLFAAGHQRTPRIALAQQVKPQLVGLLLANFMHNEENHYGVSVQDDQGRVWTAYGDFSYFNPDNETNRHYLTEALQASADEIFSAFYQGEIPPSSNVTIPHAREQEKQIFTDISPLFYWDNDQQQLLRRMHLNHPYDRQWTSHWWGWSTLLALRQQHPLSAEQQYLWQRACKYFKLSGKQCI